MSATSQELEHFAGLAAVHSDAFALASSAETDPEARLILSQICLQFHNLNLRYLALANPVLPDIPPPPDVVPYTPGDPVTVDSDLPPYHPAVRDSR